MTNAFSRLHAYRDTGHGAGGLAAHDGMARPAVRPDRGVPGVTMPGPVEVPVHDARTLTQGGVQARIDLDGQIYCLRITRQGKLILTK